MKPECRESREIDPCVRQVDPRMAACQREVFLFADWEEVLFLHFKVAPEMLAPFVPRPLELDLFEGKAYVSLVNLTMRRFLPSKSGSIGAVLRLISRERVLNLRTYVRLGEERGAYFIWGWLSQLGSLPLPSGLFGLPYAFASMDYDHNEASRTLHASIVCDRDRFGYQGTVGPGVKAAKCPPKSLAEFAMERYMGFFNRKDKVCAFRIWHEPWSQVPFEASIEENTLIKSKLPWFGQAELAESNFASGFKGVWLGKAHDINRNCKRRVQRRHVLSSFYDMP